MVFGIFPLVWREMRRGKGIQEDKLWSARETFEVEVAGKFVVGKWMIVEDGIGKLGVGCLAGWSIWAHG